MSAYSSISLMDQEHLSGWAVHLCVPDLSHLSSSPPFLEGSPVWATSVSCLTAPRTPPFIAVWSREPWTKSAYCPGSLRWVGAGLKVTFPVRHSLPRFWVITALWCYCPHLRKQCLCQWSSPYRPILNVSSLYWCDSDQHTKSHSVTIPACQPGQTHASGWRHRSKIKMAILALVEVIFWISHNDWHREDNLLNG